MTPMPRTLSRFDAEAAAKPPGKIPETPMPGSAIAAVAAATHRPCIFIACPWGPVGGGMFKAADYLVQSSEKQGDATAAKLLPLDTRGGGSAFGSIGVLLIALARLTRARLRGSLAGVHVNMAERLSVVRKGVIVVFCRMVSVPVVLHLHAAQLQHGYRSLPAPAKALVRWLFSLPASCVVLGTSAADFVTLELRVPPERVEILVNGVPEPTTPRREITLRGGHRHRVLFVGNLSERKGVSALLRAMAQPEFAGMPVDLTLAGGGDVEGYRALAGRLGLGERVRFNGWTGQDEVAQLLAQADVLVLPSVDEGLPLAILEALAHGVAVVCTPVGEIPHFLTDGVHACFVRPDDPESIAQGVLKVLKDSWLRKTLESNGRALYEQQFSLDRFSAGVARIHMRHFGVCGVSADALPATGPVSMTDGADSPGENP